MVEREDRLYGNFLRRRDAARSRDRQAAMVPVDAMSNVGRYGVRHNGAFELRWLNWVMTLGNAAETANAMPAAKRAAEDPAAAAALADLGTRVRGYVRSLPLRPCTTQLKFAPAQDSWLA